MGLFKTKPTVNFSGVTVLSSLAQNLNHDDPKVTEQTIPMIAGCIVLAEMIKSNIISAGDTPLSGFQELYKVVHDVPMSAEEFFPYKKGETFVASEEVIKIGDLALEFILDPPNDYGHHAVHDILTGGKELAGLYILEQLTGEIHSCTNTEEIGTGNIHQTIWASIGLKKDQLILIDNIRWMLSASISQNAL